MPVSSRSVVEGVVEDDVEGGVDGVLIVELLRRGA
jgi:hypothetical protein